MNPDEAAETTGKPFFYQYRPINDRLIENLSKNQIFFNDPNKFNDPFDSMYDIYFEGNKQQFIDYIKLHNHIDTIPYSINGEAIGSYSIPEKILDKWIEQEKVIQEGSSYKSTKKWEEQMDELKLPTACFSINCKDILMWSHYANYHQGVCLIYKSEGADYKIKLGTQCAKFQHVTYDKDNYIPSRKNMLKVEERNKVADFVLTKSSCWDYEKEYRIVLSDAKENYKIEKYKKESLAGIIFGLKVNFCDAYRVYKIIVDNYGKDFKFFEAVQEVVKEKDRESVKKYAIKVNKIPNIYEYLQLLRKNTIKI